MSSADPVPAEESFEKLGIPYESVNCSGAIREKGFGSITFSEHGSCVAIGGDRKLGQRGAWPPRGCGPCWFCRDTFEGPPLLIPRCKTINGVYEVFGNFCSVACAHAVLFYGLFETNAGHRSMFMHMLQTGMPGVFDAGGRAPIQRPLRDRADFGGGVAVSEWKVPVSGVVDVSRMPPVAPCLLAVSRFSLGDQEKDPREMIARAIVASQAAEARLPGLRCEVCCSGVTEKYRASIPVRRMPWPGEYETRGTFCDVACAHRFLVSSQTRNHAVNSLFIQMCHTNFPEMCDSFGRVALAPPIIDLAEFGGTRTREEWLLKKFLCDEIASVVFPPFAPTLMAVGKRYFGDRDADVLATRASKSVLIELLKTGEQIEEEVSRPNRSMVVDFPSMTNVSGGRERRISVRPCGRPTFLALATSRTVSAASAALTKNE
jgi:hypothetical protein